VTGKSQWSVQSVHQLNKERIVKHLKVRAGLVFANVLMLAAISGAARKW
jgi:hypothetical protein